jgi:hypothetical protein
MSWSEENTVAEMIEQAPAENSPEAQKNIYVGDHSNLPLDTRRVLMQLLQGPSLESQRHSILWPVLLRDEKIIRSRLSELFLDLVLDYDLQVAFTRRADTGELEVPCLLRRAPLTFIDSVFILYLRQRLTQAEAQGMRAVIAIEEVMENLFPYERSASTDRAGFVKRVNASMEKLKKYNILQKIRASENRFEISSTLKLLFSAEEIQVLTRLYRNISASNQVQEFDQENRITDEEESES